MNTVTIYLKAYTFQAHNEFHCSIYMYVYVPTYRKTYINDNLALIISNMIHAISHAFVSDLEVSRRKGEHIFVYLHQRDRRVEMADGVWMF